MKLKIFLLLVIALLATSGFRTKVFAAGFYLKSIGEVETGGQQISHWWYTATQPTLRGEAAPGADVVINIDGTSLQVSADSAGEWVFTPVSALSEGDHSVIITSSGSEINFTLTLGAGNVDWNAVGSGSASTLPTVGNLWPTVLLFIGGLGIVAAGGKMVLNANEK